MWQKITDENASLIDKGSILTNQDPESDVKMTVYKVYNIEPEETLVLTKNVSLFDTYVIDGNRKVERPDLIGKWWLQVN